MFNSWIIPCLTAGLLYPMFIHVSIGNTSTHSGSGFHFYVRLRGSLPWRGILRELSFQTASGTPASNAACMINGVIWMFPKIGVGPQNGWWKKWTTLFFNGMIWGVPLYHYFRKHPYWMVVDPPWDGNIYQVISPWFCHSSPNLGK